MIEDGLFKIIVDTTCALIIVLDVDGRIALFNKACERLTGYRFEEVKGRPFLDFLLPPEEAAGVTEVFNNLRAGQFPNQFKNHWITKSGDLRLIEWSNTALTDAAGHVTQIIGTGIDITQREQTEHALREQEEFTRLVVETAVDAVIVIDEHSTIQLFNQAAERIFGHTAAEAIGQNIRMLMPAPYREQHDGYVAHYLATGEKKIIGIGREVTGLRKNGEQFPMELAVSEIARHGQRAFTGIVRDITERKLAENQRLARDTELRAALIKEVHHRIKNNLQGVVTLLHLSSTREPGIAALIDSVTARLNAIAVVHGLHSNLGNQPLDLCAIVSSVASSLQGFYGRDSAQLRFGDGSKAVHIMDSEAVPIALIINELITNALKHNGDGESRQPVRVSLWRSGPEVCIDVVNQYGILPAKFDYAKSTRLGTGLSLVKSLLPSTGMELVIENAADGGVKASITIRPPLISEPEQPQHASAGAPHG